MSMDSHVITSMDSHVITYILNSKYNLWKQLLPISEQLSVNLLSMIQKVTSQEVSHIINIVCQPKNV